MAQVITPVANAGLQEEASKNWYRAEALRKTMTDLANIMADIGDTNAQAKAVLGVAIAAIQDARLIISPPPPIIRKRPGRRGIV